MKTDANIFIADCDKCGENNIPVIGTSFFGCCCYDCLKLVEQEAIEGRKALRAAGFTGRAKPANLKELERKKDEALTRLMGDFKKEVRL